MHIGVTGATGLVGRSLVEELLERGDRVVAFSRDPDRARESLPEEVRVERWALDDPAAIAEGLSGVEAVVNLLGEPILGRRWNAEVKAEIRASRVDGTRALVAAMDALPEPPGILVSVSAVGYYGPRAGERIEEDEPPGDDFLARVCVDWEAAARKAERRGTRVAILRLGVVLAGGGGALKKMLPPFRWFVGGKIGHGRQGFPWVHVDDVVGALLFALDEDAAIGPMNVTGPEPLSNKRFSKILGKVIHRPSWIPVPRLMLRLAIGAAAKILVTGQRAVPARLLELGYEFRFPTAREALEDLLRPEEDGG